MTSELIVGVILAAGKGNRIAPLNLDYPKPLLPIGNQPLVSYQIAAMAELGIRDIFIVIGHLGYKIVEALGDGSSYGVHIQYVEQKETLGIAHAVYQLERYIDSPFLLILGDVFFITKGLSQLLTSFANPEVGCVLGVKREKERVALRQNFAVVEDEHGRVIRVIEKPRYPPTTLKGCGIYLFHPSFFDALRRTPRTAMRNEYEITDAIQTFIDDGHVVRALDIIEEDMNLTQPQDLLRINLDWLERNDRDVEIDRTAQIDDGCQIHRSVIGAHACIDGVPELTEVVVFPGATLWGNRPVRHALVWNGGKYECSKETRHDAPYK